MKASVPVTLLVAALASTGAAQAEPPRSEPPPSLQLRPSLPPAPATPPLVVTSPIPAGASRPFSSPNLRLNNPARETLESLVPSARERGTSQGPDPSPARLLPSRGELSWRAITDALNPLAPIPPEMRRVRYVHELTRPVDHAYPRSLRDPLTPAIPRAFQDPITHEASLRLW